MVLPALAGVAAAFTDATWNFDGDLNATSTPSIDRSNGSLNTGAAAYNETGLTVGVVVGRYELTADLGQAVTLDSTHLVKTATAYWSNEAGRLAIGADGTSFTLVSYVKFDSVAGEQLFFGTGSGNGGGLAFGLKDGKLDLLAKGAAHHELTTTPAIETNTWYNLAVSYDTTVGTAVFYVNGDSVGSITGLKNVNFNSAGGGACAFAGQIAEFQILSGVKTQSEILKAAHLSIPEPATATLSLLALAGLALRRRR